MLNINCGIKGDCEDVSQRNKGAVESFVDTASLNAFHSAIVDGVIFRRAEEVVIMMAGVF